MEERDLRAPTGWAEDKVSEFLEVSQQNSFATFANLQTFFGQVVTLDALFRQALENFGRPNDWLPGVFLLRTHAAFLGAVRLGVSGQLPETYMVLRSCIESALYALHIEKETSRAQIWVRRAESEEDRKKAKAEFTARRVFDTLKGVDVPTHDVVKYLYEQTIDHGAHPNERAFLSNMGLTDTGEAFRLELRYLSGDTPAFRLCLKSLLQVVVAALTVFQFIAPEKSAILGISDKLRDLRRGL